jgi:hypothetical protein
MIVPVEISSDIEYCDDAGGLCRFVAGVIGENGDSCFLDRKKSRLQKVREPGCIGYRYHKCDWCLETYPPDQSQV